MLATAFGARWLGINRNHLMVARDQPFQRGNREIRRTHKNDFEFLRQLKDLACFTQFIDLAHDHIALQFGDMINEENTVQVIEFMLHAM